MLWGFLGFTALAMVGGAIAVLIPRWGIGDEVLGSISLIGVYVLGAIVIVIYGKRMPITRMFCLIGLLVSLVFFLIGIWFYSPLSRFWENVVWSTASIALAIAGGLAHRVFVWPVKPRGLSSAILKWASIVFAFMTVGVIVFGFASMGPNYWGRAYQRVMGVSVILTAGTTIATGVIALFGIKPGEDEDGVIGSAIQVSICCPRCGADTKAVMNRESRCTGCRLKVRIEVEEPRCSCGYLLYQLESDVCPECGKAIAELDRWGHGQREGEALS